MKKAVIGILAHVDAGKTTLSEDLLYRTGAIRKKGSVDQGSTVMDSDAVEEERGITVYSSTALIRTDEMELTLLDTPGHVDFSGETERTVAALDCAILLISAPEGVQSHTRTLWDILRKRKIPTFIFVNKMDLAQRSGEVILSEIKGELSKEALSFMPASLPSAMEDIASLSEEGMNTFLTTGTLPDEAISRAVGEGEVFPVLFGSAREGEGTDLLLTALARFLPAPVWPDEFGALCYKVERDEKGKRVAFLKITGGTLLPRMEIRRNTEEEIGGEKVTELRLYRGGSYQNVQEAPAGTICAVPGLITAFPGAGYGAAEDLLTKETEPVFRCRVLPEGDVSSHTLLTALKELEEADPLLNVTWDRKTDAIHISLMGEIQKEIIGKALKDRYEIEARFEEAGVTYRETVASEGTGHGHFEPLRHFADVEIRIEPLPEGSGISAVSECSSDELEDHYQRQVLRRLLSGRQTGVLLNAELTDVRFVLLHGKSHKKHTVGGDFRKATDVAVRDALLHTEGKILEPYYRVRLLIPSEKTGRALTDLTQMHGMIDPPGIDGDRTMIEGLVPVTELGDYAASVSSYTGGLGNLSIEPGGYYACHDPEEVIKETAYNFRTDPDHPYESIYVHQETAPLDPTLDGRHRVEREGRTTPPSSPAPGTGRKRDGEEASYMGYGDLEPDLKEIFERTYGKIERKDLGQALTLEAGGDADKKKEEAREFYLSTHPGERERRDHVRKKEKKLYVLVDCYNVIFQTPELRALSEKNLDSARGRLLSLLSNYQGYLGCTLIAVFDAWKVKGNPGSSQKINNIYVVYTKEAQTADAYIERSTHEIMHAGDAEIIVVTSDGAEQMIVAGEGARRISSREFASELDRVGREGMEAFHRKNPVHP